MKDKSTMHFLDTHKRSLEEAFFAKHNEDLLLKFREKTARQDKKKALAAASGIVDDVVLEHLVALDISGETLAALTLVPLLEVAWADGHVDGGEKEAILSEAAKAGLSHSSAAYHLLENWIGRRPDASLVAVWKEYVGALSRTLTAEAREAIKRDLLQRARTVATAEGGFLGMGDRISERERRALEGLEQAFG